jgi:hypothetical protein
LILKKTILSNTVSGINESIVELIAQYCCGENIKKSQNQDQENAALEKEDCFWESIDALFGSKHSFALSAANDGLIVCWHCVCKIADANHDFTRVWSVNDLRDPQKLNAIKQHSNNHVRSWAGITYIRFCTPIEHVLSETNMALVRGYRQQSIGIISLDTKIATDISRQIKYLFVNTMKLKPKSKSISKSKSRLKPKSKSRLKPKSESRLQPKSKSRLKPTSKSELESEINPWASSSMSPYEMPSQLLYDWTCDYYWTDSEIKNDYNLPHRIVKIKKFVDGWEGCELIDD